VLQTIFARLLRRPWAPNLKQNPKAYLYRAAVNVSLTAIRSRRHSIETVDADTIERPAATGEPGIDERIRERLLRALDEMAVSNASDAELLILRYFHNCSDAEIAKVLGKSRGAIALRLYRARARLKKIMDSKPKG
jgi:RNA polymerase sigma-70 factor (ECF subfamily)